MFPTIYGDKEYDSCAIGSSGSYLWCSIRTKANVYTGDWAYCGENCAESKVINRQPEFLIPVFFSLATIITKNNLLKTIPNWGPSWRLSFDVNIVSFTDFDGTDYDGAWADIVQLTATGNPCCDVGDRVPYVQANKNGYFIVGTGIGNEGNYYFQINDRNKLLWYSVKISQIRENGKVKKVHC